MPDVCMIVTPPHLARCIQMDMEKWEMGRWGEILAMLAGSDVSVEWFDAPARIKIYLSKGTTCAYRGDWIVREETSKRVYVLTDEEYRRSVVELEPGGNDGLLP